MIITAQQVQSYLDVTVNAAKLQVIVDAVNAACLRAMHRSALYVSGVQYTHSPPYTANLMLNWPIISIESIHEDWEGYFGQREGAFGDDSALTLGEDFFYDPNNPKGPVMRIGGVWSTVPGSLKVDYTWGWASPPADMIQAALKLASLAWNSRFRPADLQSETFGKYSYQLLSGGSTGQADVDSDLLAVRRVIKAYALESI